MNKYRCAVRVTTTLEVEVTASGIINAIDEADRESRVKLKNELRTHKESWADGVTMETIRIEDVT